MAGRTTISCSVVGVAALVISSASADRPSLPEGRLFPVRLAWTLALNNALAAGPAFSGSRGYFPLESARLAAYDLTAGTLLWVVPGQPKFPPAASDELIFLAEAARLTALRANDGTVAWQVPIVDELTVAPVWNNGWLMVATEAGAILAVRGTDGTILWQQNYGSPVHAPPAVAADRVYAPLRDGRLLVLRLEDGGLVWQRRFIGAPNEILALEERLYVGSNDNRFYCLRLRDGELFWRWPTGADVIGMPVADEQRVYFVSLDNVLRGLDRNSGAQRWKRVLAIRPSYQLVRAGEALLVAGAAATLSAFNTRDGAPAGQIPLTGELAAAPHVQPGAVPRLTVVTRDIAKGAIVTTLARTVDPVESVLGTLPNPVPAPKAPAP